MFEAVSASEAPDKYDAIDVSKALVNFKTTTDVPKALVNQNHVT
jgi:hypothetical protein